MLPLNVTLTVTEAGGIIKVRVLPDPLTNTVAPVSFLFTLIVAIEYPVFADIVNVTLLPAGALTGTMNDPPLEVVFVME